MSLQMVRKAKELLLPLWGLYLGLNVDEIGYVIGASSALDMILFLPVGYIMDKRGRKWMSIPTCFILALGLFLIPLTFWFIFNCISFQYLKYEELQIFFQ